MHTTEDLIFEFTRPFREAKLESPPSLDIDRLRTDLSKAGFDSKSILGPDQVSGLLSAISNVREDSVPSEQLEAYRSLLTTITRTFLDSDSLCLPSKVVGYTNDEVALIQDSIAGKFRVSRDQGEAALPDLMKSFPDARELPALLPIYFQDRSCYQKVYWDPRVESMYIYPFFPQVIAVGLDDIEITPGGRNRMAVKFTKNGESFYIKSLQTESEGEISALAARLDVGAQQLPTLNGYITEASVTGHSLHRLPEAMNTEDNIRLIGSNLALALRRLHQAGIAFNDTIILDDFGHSHLIIQDDCSVKLIDYGNALKLADCTNPSPEFLRNYQKSRFAAPSLLEKLKPGNNVDHKHFTDYDIELVRQGIYFASSRGMPTELLDKFSQAFYQSYNA